MENFMILMADIIKSSDADQTILMENFQLITETVNKRSREVLLSPLTITLGDEFQGIAKSLPDALNMIIDLEESIIAAGYTFKLRYVLHEGAIDTPINEEIAYGMLGEGLTYARNALNKLKRGEGRFNTSLIDAKKTLVLNQTFLVLQHIIDDWNIAEDSELVTNFLIYNWYKTVAAVMNRDRTVIFKRKKSLKINDYNALKSVVNYLGGGHTNA